MKWRRSPPTRGRPALEVAEHQLRSGQASAAAAVQMTRSVAREIARVAPSAAANVMLKALDAADPHDPARPALIADAVGLLAGAARLAEARKLGEEALGGLDPDTEALLLLGLAEAFKYDGMNDTAARYATRGLEHIGIPDAIRARLHAIRAHALFYCDDLDAADASGSGPNASAAAARSTVPRCWA